MVCTQVTPREPPGPDAGSASCRASPLSLLDLPCLLWVQLWVGEPWLCRHRQCCISVLSPALTAFPLQQLSHQLSLLCHLERHPHPPVTDCLLQVRLWAQLSGHMVCQTLK